MSELKETIKKLVQANRILAAEGVVDAFGHISVRHPERADRYLISCSRSPELVKASDIMEIELDGTPVDAKGRSPYLERFIHGSVYQARPDVMSVMHNHSYEIIPFGVSKIPLRPIFHSAGRLGQSIPVWDIRKKFGDTDLLVTDMERGRDLVACLGKNNVALMRGHGCVVSGPALETTVLTSIYLRVNARLQREAMQMGDVTFLSPGEIDRSNQLAKPKVGDARAWEYLCARAKVDPADL